MGLLIIVGFKQIQEIVSKEVITKGNKSAKKMQAIILVCINYAIFSLKPFEQVFLILI